jgi:diguanylate cyclase (GGDEF)-like protein
LMLAVLTIRSVAALVGVGGELTPMHFNQFQAGMVVVLVFLSMMWCFGFLLMAIDRLRSEVAKLAMLDDLTGVANRRLLLQRLSEQCVLSQRTGEPFAILAIDLDGFKAVNDSFGHGAGDECLRAFSRVAQGRLRPGDLLARVGGDEFCVLMPSTTLREGAMIARWVMEACRMEGEDAMRSISASIGVAHWTEQVGADPDRLIAAADQALYIAKRDGKNRYAVYDPQPAVPEAQEQEPEPLRLTA